MGSDISKISSGSASDGAPVSENISLSETAPLTLSATKFAADLREKVKAGAEAFMADVGNDLPGANMDDPLEARKYLAQVIQEVTLRVMIAVEDSKSRSLSSKDTKNLITEASRVHDQLTLFTPRSFAKTSAEEIHSRSNDYDYWRYKVSGAVRAEMLGIKSGEEIGEALGQVIVTPELRQIFHGTNGQRILSHLYSKGGMLFAHSVMSKACKEEGLNLKKDFGWTVLPGSTHDLKITQQFVVQNFENLKGIEGYRNFAIKYMGGRMHKAHAFVHAVCRDNDLKFDDLGWNTFQGTVEKFDAVSADLKNNFQADSPSFGSLKGLEAYKAFSIKHSEGHMLRCHQLASSVCKYMGYPFKELGWFQFPGSVKNFEELTGLVKKDFASIKGLDGHQAIAEGFADGKMDQAYGQMHGVCKAEKLPFSDLGWNKIFGTTIDFQKLVQDSLLNYRRYQEKLSAEDKLSWSADSPLMSEHSQADLPQGASGSGGQIDQGAIAHAKKISTILYESGKFAPQGMQWSTLAESAKAICNILNQLRAKNSPGASILTNLKGIEGHKVFAREHTEGQMLKAFTLVSAICKMEGENFDELGWVVFMGSVDQYEHIHDGIAKLQNSGKLDNLLTLDISDRLPQLISDIQEISPTHKKLLKSVLPKDFYSALPEKLTPEISKQHFSVGYLRLDLDGESVYFDSNPERICGYLLHKYGFVDKFVEGKNLHVRANNINRINLDFFIESKKLFIEYHPLSISEIYAGVTLEQAGLRKTESIKHGKYSDCRAVHISDYDGLYDVLTKDLGLELSLNQFKRDLADAQAYGYQCDEIHEYGISNAGEADTSNLLED